MSTRFRFSATFPILGEFFRSKSYRERRTELLVIVAPELVQGKDTPDAVPTGEPLTWKWPGWMRQELESQPLRWGDNPMLTDTLRRPPTTALNGEVDTKDPKAAESWEDTNDEADA